MYRRVHPKTIEEKIRQILCVDNEVDAEDPLTSFQESDSTTFEKGHKASPSKIAAMSQLPNNKYLPYNVTRTTYVQMANGNQTNNQQRVVFRTQQHGFRSVSSQPRIYASGTNQGAIDNRIEQAMDLVKSHLMSAVRGEVEELKEKIQCLEDKISCLQSENELLRASVPQEVLLQISTNQPAMITGGNPVPALTSIMSSSAASTTASVTSGAISASSDTSASTPNPSNPPPAASTSSSTPSQVAPAPTHQGQQPPPQGSASGSNQTQPSSSSQALPTPPTS